MHEAEMVVSAESILKLYKTRISKRDAGSRPKQAKEGTASCLATMMGVAHGAETYRPAFAFLLFCRQSDDKFRAVCPTNPRS
jgi:hypothetical protein